MYALNNHVAHTLINSSFFNHLNILQNPFYPLLCDSSRKSGSEKGTNIAPYSGKCCSTFAHFRFLRLIVFVGFILNVHEERNKLHGLKLYLFRVEHLKALRFIRVNSCNTSLIIKENIYVHVDKFCRLFERVFSSLKDHRLTIIFLVYYQIITCACL